MLSFLRKNNGFTLVELIVVITVIGILTGGAALSLTANAKQSRDTRRKTDLQQIKAALEFYRADQTNGNYPTTTGAAGYRTGSAPNFTYPALVPAYLETMIRDPSSTDTTVVDYAYAAFAADGVTACNNTTVFCATYTLTATEMETQPDYVVTPLSTQ